MSITNKMFRIFISSTFADLKEERNALHKEVFPKLNELCIQNGFGFQAIDLRWGVTKEATRDHKTMKICLGEIERCRSISPRPNFVVLLGERYGWQPLPAEINHLEFKSIIKQIKDRDNRKLLLTWYKLDRNSVPAVYNLLPFSEENMGNASMESLEKRLRKILVPVAESVLGNSIEYNKYFASATEQEITHGALSIENAAEHVFCFFRTIEDLRLNTECNNYVDIDDQEHIDQKAQERLELLKESLRKKLPNNIYEYQTKREGKTINLDYLEKFCTDVYESLKKVIEMEIQLTEEVDLFEQEIQNHELFAQNRAKNFVGREEYLKKIYAHSEEPNQYPLIIIGEPGCGKSALLAKAVELMRLKSKRLIVISRFIGASPDSANPKELLFGICREIIRQFKRYLNDNEVVGKIFKQISALVEEQLETEELFQRFKSYLFESIESGPALIEAGFMDNKYLLELKEWYKQVSSFTLDEFVRKFEQISYDYKKFMDELDESLIPQDYEELVQQFPKRLSHMDDLNVVLIIDALDQLEENDLSNALSWIPFFVTGKISLIVSTTPNEWLSNMEKRLPEGNILKLDNLKINEAKELLNKWMLNSGRTLTFIQRRKVHHNFKITMLPLYLKLAFEQAKHWKSYDKNLSLSPGINLMISDYYEQLYTTLNHSKIVITKILGYLSASRYGLSENELIEILSKDVKVMDYINKSKFHELPEQKLPIAIWSRLYFDIQPYLTERNIEGTKIYTFFHKQLREIAGKLYLQDESRRSYHSNLAAYFENERDTIRIKDTNIPNSRKLLELPYQLFKGEEWAKLENLLCDLEFIENKLRLQNAFDLLQDYQNVYLEKNSDANYISHNIKDFHEFVQNEIYILREYPHLVMQQALNQPDDSSVTNAAQLYQKGKKHSYVRWLNKPISKDTQLILKNFPVHSRASSVTWSPDLLFVAGFSTNNFDEIMVYDTKTGKEISSIQGNRYTVDFSWSPDSKLIATSPSSNNRKLSVYDIYSGQLYCDFENEITYKSKTNLICWDSIGERVGYIGDNNVVIYDIKLKEQITAFQIKNEQIFSCALVNNGNYFLIIYLGWELTLWEVSTGKMVFQLWEAREGILSKTRSHYLFQGINGIEILDLFHLELKNLFNQRNQFFVWANEKNDCVAIISEENHITMVWICDIFSSSKQFYELKRTKKNENRIMKALVNIDLKLMLAISIQLIELWDLSTSSLLGCFPHNYKYFGNLNITWYKEGKEVLIQDTDNTVLISVENLKINHNTYNGHSMRGEFLSWSYDESHVISCSLREVLLWTVDKNFNSNKFLEDNTEFIACIFDPSKPILYICERNRHFTYQYIENLYELKNDFEPTYLSEENIIKTSGYGADLWSPSGKYLAIRNKDLFIIKNIDTSDNVLLINNYNRLEWSPDSTKVAVSKGNDFEVWDIRTKSRIFVFSAKNFIWAPDSQQFLVDTSIRNTNDFNEIINLQDIVGPINLVNWSSDGSTMAFIQSNDYEVFIYEVKQGKKINVINHQDIPIRGDRVIHFSHDAKAIIILYKDNYYRTWDLKTSSLLSEIYNDGSGYTPSPDGSIIFASQKPNYKVFNSYSGNEIFSFEDERLINRHLTIEWTRDNKKFYMNTDEYLFEYDASTWNLTFVKYCRNIAKCSWSTDNRRFLLCFHKSEISVRTFDWISKKEICKKTISNLFLGAECKLSPDLKKLAVLNEKEIIIIDRMIDKIQIIIHNDEYVRLNSCSWAPDSVYLLCAGYEKLKIWNTLTGELVKEVILSSQGMCADWSPDGKELLLGGPSGIGIYNLDTSEKYDLLTANIRFCCRWLQDKNRIAYINSNSNFLVVYDMEKKKEVYRWKTSSEITYISQSPGKRFLGLTGSQGEIYFVELRESED